jgi:hypothetical protein
MALLNTRPGKEAEVEEFLKSAQPLVAQEAGTTAWYAIKIGPAAFGIFDTFVDEEGRSAHVSGAIAKALSQKPRNCLPPLPRSRWLRYWRQKRPTTS